MVFKFWKSNKNSSPVKPNKDNEEKLEKIRREYAIKAQCLHDFMNIPTLTQMSKACAALEKDSNPGKLDWRKNKRFVPNEKY